MTGWGQEGPLAQAAGHDIDYIAITGALHAIGPRGGAPLPPLNLVGDFGGGAMMLAFGIAAALVEAQRSGRGQVVDAAMSDGAALLGAMLYGMHAAGFLTSERGENLLDGGAHFYGTYACADGKYVAVGAIEPRFHAELLRRCGIDDPDFEAQLDRDRWPRLREKLAAVFRTRTRDEWCAILEGTDACFAPVLDWEEAPRHPHNVARGTFVTVDDVVQPAPAPRFDRTPSASPHRSTVLTGRDLARALRDWGLRDDVIGRLGG
jgi:alpha-methylacyl-CoA racemase